MILFQKKQNRRLVLEDLMVLTASLQIKKLSVKVKKWKKRQALGLPRGGRPRKPKMLEEEDEEDEVVMSDGLSDQEEYMEYSIVQHEVMYSPW